MNWNLILFVVFPYVAIVLAIVGTVYRWGTASVHRFVGLITAPGEPEAVLGLRAFSLGNPSGAGRPPGRTRASGRRRQMNQVPIRLYLLEFTGLALAVWALFGLAVLVNRRITVARSGQ